MVKNKLIELKNIVKSYDGEIAVDHMNLYIRENEFIESAFVRSYMEFYNRRPVAA